MRSPGRRSRPRWLYESGAVPGTSEPVLLSRLDGPLPPSWPEPFALARYGADESSPLLAVGASRSVSSCSGSSYSRAPSRAPLRATRLALGTSSLEARAASGPPSSRCSASKARLLEGDGVTSVAPRRPPDDESLVMDEIDVWLAWREVEGSEA